MDPTNPQHLIVSPHFSCAGNNSMSCFLETHNAGATWNVIQNTPSSGENSGQMMVNNTTWFAALAFGGLSRTADEGATWTTVANANGYAYPFLAQPPDAGFFVPAAFNVIQSSDGITWNTIANSPNASDLTNSATKLYVGTGNCVDSNSGATYWEASIANPAKWTQMPSPSTNSGSGFIAYDQDHGILYSSNCLGGIWRVTTK
jgi:hypothetical protein